MSLQQNIIKDYRLAFPNDTLREIANRTGIQLTRVFRLLNGSPMKLAEYESFYDLLDSEKSKSETFTAVELLRSQGHKLSRIEMHRIYQYIQRKLYLTDLVQSHQPLTIQQQELA